MARRVYRCDNSLTVEMENQPSGISGGRSASGEPGLSRASVYGTPFATEPRGRAGLLLSWGLAVLVVAGLVTFILHVSDLTAFVGTIRAADPIWIAAALACQVTTYICAALVWNRALARSASVVAVGDLFGLAIVELFANQAMPTGGLSGSLIVVRGLIHRGVKGHIAVTALLVAALSYFAAYLMCAFAAFALLWHMGDFSNASAVLLVIFATVVAVIAGAVLVLTRSRGEFIPAFALAWRPVARLAAMLRQVRMDMLRDGRVVSASVALQFSVFFLDAATLWCACRAVDLHIGPGRAFVSFIFASIVATLSPIPLGLGTFEGTCIGMLHFLGAGLEASVAATLILRGLTLWLPMVPGLWMMRRETKRLLGGRHQE